MNELINSSDGKGQVIAKAQTVEQPTASTVRRLSKHGLIVGANGGIPSPEVALINLSTKRNVGETRQP